MLFYFLIRPKVFPFGLRKIPTGVVLLFDCATMEVRLSAGRCCSFWLSVTGTARQTGNYPIKRSLYYT